MLFKPLFKACLTATLCLSLSAQANEASGSDPIFIQNYQFQKGTDYEELKNPLSISGREMREFFSFYCPHCRHAQQAIMQLSERLPEGMKISLNPVPWMGPAEAAETSQLALAAAVTADREQEFMQELFQEISDDRNVPSTSEEITAVFAESTGLDPELLQDPNLKLTVNQWNSIADILDVQFVPGLIINGRYELNIALLDDPDRAAALIAYLNSLK